MRVRRYIEPAESLSLEDQAKADTFCRMLRSGWSPLLTVSRYYGWSVGASGVRAFETRPLFDVAISYAHNLLVATERSWVE